MIDEKNIALVEDGIFIDTENSLLESQFNSKYNEFLILTESALNEEFCNVFEESVLNEELNPNVDLDKITWASIKDKLKKFTKNVLYHVINFINNLILNLKKLYSKYLDIKGKNIVEKLKNVKSYKSFSCKSFEPEKLIKAKDNFVKATAENTVFLANFLNCFKDLFINGNGERLAVIISNEKDSKGKAYTDKGKVDFIKFYILKRAGFLKRFIRFIFRDNREPEAATFPVSDSSAEIYEKSGEDNYGNREIYRKGFEYAVFGVEKDLEKKDTYITENSMSASVCLDNIKGFMTYYKELEANFNKIKESFKAFVANPDKLINILEKTKSKEFQKHKQFVFRNIISIIRMLNGSVFLYCDTIVSVYNKIVSNYFTIANGIIAHSNNTSEKK